MPVALFVVFLWFLIRRTRDQTGNKTGDKSWSSDFDSRKMYSKITLIPLEV